MDWKIPPSPGDAIPEGQPFRIRKHLFPPIPPEVLADPNLVIGIPRPRCPDKPRTPFRGRSHSNMSRAETVVRQALLVGNAALAHGGYFPHDLRDEIFALARAGDGAASMVAQWLLRARLVTPVMIAANDNGGTVDKEGSP